MSHQMFLRTERLSARAWLMHDVSTSTATLVTKFTVYLVCLDGARRTFKSLLLGSIIVAVCTFGTHSQTGLKTTQLVHSGWLIAQCSLYVLVPSLVMSPSEPSKYCRGQLDFP